ncbi:MAG: Gfo/Idh/MocA family oxidoreductase [Ruminococcaceae bacterium]|nr:Gfo/Idh/MocA family oxidoreductase [Oscillospiraceae bacterium]
MAKINVAVIGCGTIANSAHIPSYMNNEKVNIKYFCDIIPERAEAAVEKYGCGKAVVDYREILDDDEITAVSVCTPNYAHAEISNAFLKAGKTVLCEKPAARTYDEALTMQKTQAETGNALSIGVVNRFNDGVNQIKKLIDAGELGEIYQVYVSFRAHRAIPGLGGAFTTKAIAGGGVLIDWGVHFLDIVMYCCSDPEPKTVSAECFSKLGTNIEEYVYKDMWAGPPVKDGTYDVEEYITGIVRTNGPVITLNGAWAQNIGVGEMYIDFIGTKAGIRLQYGQGFKVYGVKDGELTTTPYDPPTTNHFRNEINAFVDSAINKTRLPSNIDINITTSKLMQALYDSAESHREIVL